jgi:3-oxoacyl-[acyl-carrier protein] reductase
VNVVVNYVTNLTAADDVAAAINSKRDGAAVVVRADVSTAAGRNHLLDECLRVFGKLDILVLNAGIMGSKPIADVDEAFFDAHMETNVKGPFFFAKAAIPHLVETGLFRTTRSKLICPQHIF